MILQTLLKNIGIKDEIKILTAFNIIDKLNKLTEKELTHRLINEVGLTPENVVAIYELTQIRNICDLEKLIGKDSETYQEINQLFDMAKRIGIEKWLKLDLSIIRGISYYTGIVFEVYFKNTSIKRAVCGGGRYDNLLQTYGYKNKVTTVGFGMGNIVLINGLEELGLLPKFTLDIDYVIVPYSDSYFADAYEVANKLRDINKIVDVYQGTKIRNAYDYANKKNAKYVILIAPDEWKNKKIVVKDMLTTDKNKKQVTVDIDEYIKMSDNNFI